MFAQIITTVFTVSSLICLCVFAVTTVLEYNPPEWVDKLTGYCVLTSLSSGFVIAFILAFHFLYNMWMG